jgi:hypothetical protein
MKRRENLKNFQKSTFFFDVCVSYGGWRMADGVWRMARDSSKTARPILMKLAETNLNHPIMI